MFRSLLSGISEKSARVSMLLFFGLLTLSVTFFVSADDSVTNKNIFQDSDQDGLSNDEEVLYKTDALKKDTDGDGYTDGVEVESGYDPLKPAPGDKLVPDAADLESERPLTTSNETNLTNQVSAEIANMVQNSTTAEGEEITIENINESVQNVLNQSDQEIILPEVNIDDIKIKKVSKKLKGEKRDEQEKEDVLEYLSVMAYILANNSPKSFSSESDLNSVVTGLSMDSLSAIALGNTKYLGELAEKGEKMLSEIKDVSVPEGMLDVHVKAIKMAKYSMTLQDEVNVSDQTDPLGKIASLSKIQGFVAITQDFSLEVYKRLNEYGIEGIPLSL